MPLKPWHKIEGLTPREDLREGKPQDTAEFAVHLDQVRDRRAPADYQNPERFFDRTYLTKSLTEFAALVVRRLSGETAQTPAIFNLSTQFGGGKTHALTLLYHLAKQGSKADRWTGVPKILAKAEMESIPEAAVAVFVGTEFDSLSGRGGDDGTPRRQTPWGEIAYQLGGEAALAAVAEQEKQFIEPKGDVIRQFLPDDKPCLILMDEILNYVSTYRQKGYGDRLYNFMQALSETARGQNNVVLVVSIPASEMEYTEADEADEKRFKKMLDRLGKATMLSAESETSEIIRRRLFEWNEKAVTADGKIMLPTDAIATCNEYADWAIEHRQQLPSFPVDDALEAFKATYPFHPSVLSVFERKWQALPQFQRTRGILRLLALWVSKAYQDGYRGSRRDPLIGLGTAPLDDPNFRAALFEQMGQERLEGAITTDIAGKKEAHALQLDEESVEAIKKARLHRKVATAIFFESNGGCTRTEATLPEIRMAVGEPDLDIGNVETVLEALSAECYYLSVNRTKYYFSIHPNLNKILADRRASVRDEAIDRRVREAIEKQFAPGRGLVQIVPFPDKPGDIPNQPTLTLAVLAPEHAGSEEETSKFVDGMIREVGASARTYKSALMFAIADSDATLRADARKLLAWEAIREEESDRLDETQRKQLAESLKKAERDLRETVWRSYKYVMLLGKDNRIRTVNLGLITSSAAASLPRLIVDRLQQDGDIEDAISPRFLVRNWPPAFREWSTKAIRDAFFASPQFPRLLDPDAVKTAIARGVRDGHFAYVGKVGDRYDPFEFKSSLSDDDVELSEDAFAIQAEDAEAYQQRITDPPRLSAIVISPDSPTLEPGQKQTFTVRGEDQYERDFPVAEVRWGATGGEITAEGVLTAGEDAGNFTVTAAVGDIRATAPFSVGRVRESARPESAKVGEKSGDYDTATGDPVSRSRSLEWTGEITSQKWMNFYMRVLSKFANEQDLKLTLQVHFSVEGDITEQQREETRVALEELGLYSELES
ncbi:DUF499 domain-containing protein [Lyngbya sp. CCY1209]|uniref:ATP-binding protein n=1 Tax=Lyngbya sp. CCY1209 TaxID=2886103 RepID=UPI002D214773|nr:DUF499 domain-containing protein [Lyngbya sp. CCY1209]MEB3886137.1 DUF499 domain-containing protein [Lyngbya sp. CCY1209]